MILRLIAFLLKRTSLKATIYGELGRQISGVARYAPSAWENKDQVEKRRLYELLGGPEKTLTGWRSR